MYSFDPGQEYLYTHTYYMSKILLILYEYNNAHLAEYMSTLCIRLTKYMITRLLIIIKHSLTTKALSTRSLPLGFYLLENTRSDSGGWRIANHRLTPFPSDSEDESARYEIDHLLYVN